MVMYVACNIGVWKEKSNTLSVFYITILTPVFSERRRQALFSAFKAHINEMGYGQEVMKRAFNFVLCLFLLSSSLCSLRETHTHILTLLARYGLLTYATFLLFTETYVGTIL